MYIVYTLEDSFDPRYGTFSSVVERQIPDLTAGGSNPSRFSLFALFLVYKMCVGGVCMARWGSR
jgi:hypothetical protein